MTPRDESKTSILASPQETALPKPDYDPTQLNKRRVCRSCEKIYTISDAWQRNESYFDSPYDYQIGCVEYCLECWLGVGPLDISESPDQRSCGFGDDTTALNEEGDLLRQFQRYLDEGMLLAVMPVSRIFVDSSSITYRDRFTFFPAGCANLYDLNIKPNREANCPLTEAQSAAAGITEQLLSELPLVAFPCRIDWTSFCKTDHEGHLDLIRQLSESVDRGCLDYVRYRLCGFEPVDSLPGRAGQVSNNPMMAGLCLFNPAENRARIVGGAAFTHMLTRGLGLSLESIGFEEFPRSGEIGHIVEHALSLYSAAIEGTTATSRFVQALSILEFLADPDDYCNFQDVKKIISRYVAANRQQYEELLDRFHVLTGKKDESGKIIGLRTRAVHMGERLEQMIPDQLQRSELFRELDRYIHAVLEHMIRHSEMSQQEYWKLRETLRPFELEPGQHAKEPQQTTYDHSTKIGNQGDVVKHVALFTAIRQLLKDWPLDRDFVYADIHAGRPEYVLPDKGEWQQGIRPLSANQQLVADRLNRSELGSRLGTVGEFDEAFLNRLLVPGMVYPGSSGIAFRLLSKAKVPFQLILCETNRSAADDIKSHFHALQAAVTVLCGDGYELVKGDSPLSFVLIDPPALEIDAVIQAMKALNARNVPFICWTPRTSRSVKPVHPGDVWSAAESGPSVGYIRRAEECGTCLPIQWHAWGHRTPGCCITVSAQLAAVVQSAVNNIVGLMGWEISVPK